MVVGCCVRQPREGSQSGCTTHVPPCVELHLVAAETAACAGGSHHLSRRGRCQGLLLQRPGVEPAATSLFPGSHVARLLCHACCGVECAQVHPPCGFQYGTDCSGLPRLLWRSRNTAARQQGAVQCAAWRDDAHTLPCRNGSQSTTAVKYSPQHASTPSRVAESPQTTMQTRECCGVRLQPAASLLTMRRRAHAWPGGGARRTSGERPVAVRCAVARAAARLVVRPLPLQLLLVHLSLRSALAQRPAHHQSSSPLTDNRPLAHSIPSHPHHAATPHP